MRENKQTEPARKCAEGKADSGISKNVKLVALKEPVETPPGNIEQRLS